MPWALVPLPWASSTHPHTHSLPPSFLPFLPYSLPHLLPHPPSLTPSFPPSLTGESLLDALGANAPPVGLIHTSVGGSMIEEWTTADVIAQVKCVCEVGVGGWVRCVGKVCVCEVKCVWVRCVCVCVCVCG